MSAAQTWDPASYARNARFVSDLSGKIKDRSGKRCLLWEEFGGYFDVPRLRVSCPASPSASPAGAERSGMRRVPQMMTCDGQIRA
jgi:hypothetical protein